MVYERTTRDLVQDVLKGYNATVFAYGPTGEVTWRSMSTDTGYAALPNSTGNSKIFRMFVCMDGP